MQGESSPLLGGVPGYAPISPFNYNRTVKDVKWKVAYWGVVSILSVAGIALAFTGSPDFAVLISREHLADPASCPANQPGRRRLLGSSDEESGNLNALGAHLVGAISGTFLGSLALGALFLLTVRRSAHVLVHTAMGLQIIVPVSLAVIAFIGGNMVSGALLLAFAGLYAWLFVAWRPQIALVTRLLGITGAALVANPGIIGLSLMLPLVWGGTVLVPAGVFTWGAVRHGSVVPSSARYGPPVPSSNPDVRHDVCVDEGGNVINCCAWQLEWYAITYLSLLGVVLTWTSMLFSMVRTYVAAGATAQWYFAPVEDSPSGSAGGSLEGPVKKGGRGAAKGRVSTALSYALGPSFGSLCAAAALLTVVSYMRQALDSCERRAAQEGGVGAVVFMILAFILRFMLALVEFLTRFTVVRMAITGEGFSDAGHGCVDLLKRNAMDAFGVWWLPPFILNSTSFVVSVGFGCITYLSARLVWGTGEHDFSAVALGYLSGALALVVVVFFSGLLLNVLDAVFICFAMDRDSARVTRQDVFTVMSEMPGAGPVVQQPDGNLAYAAPA